MRHSRADLFFLPAQRMTISIALIGRGNRISGSALTLGGDELELWRWLAVAEGLPRPQRGLALLPNVATGIGEFGFLAFDVVQAVFQHFAFVRGLILAPSAERRPEAVNGGVAPHVDLQQLQHRVVGAGGARLQAGEDVFVVPTSFPD